MGPWSSGKMGVIESIINGILPKIATLQFCFVLPINGKKEKSFFYHTEIYDLALVCPDESHQR